MTQVTATVTKTNATERQGRKGPFTAYSFQCDQVEGWIGAGFRKPPFTEGDTIQFSYELNAKGYKQLSDAPITKVDKASAPKPTVTQAKGRDDYWTEKAKRDIEVVEPRITLSASRTAAIQVIGLALAHDAIVFGNASKGAKLGIILDAIDEVTGRYYQQSMKGSAPDTEVPEEDEYENDEYQDTENW